MGHTVLLHILNHVHISPCLATLHGRGLFQLQLFNLVNYVTLRVTLWCTWHHTRGTQRTGLLHQ
jgi:hypothetical protein